jgi:predicted amidohydrolase YtcJ
MDHGKRNGLLIAAVICALPTASIARDPDSKADAVFYNGKVITMEELPLGANHPNVKPRTKIAAAFAVKDGRYVAVGSGLDMLRLVGPKTRKVDLRGRTVVPGLNDSHFHSVGGGPGMDLSQARTLADVYATIAKAAAAAQPGQVLVSNSDWHEAQLVEQRLPLASELDVPAPNNPVVLVRGGHEYILNNVALKFYNITPQTPVPAGGAIPRLPNGELNGELVDNARNLARLPANPPLTPAQQRQALLDTQSWMNSLGVVGVRNASSSVSAYRQWQGLRDEGAITLRNSFLFGGPSTEAAVNTFVATQNVKDGEGDDWLRVVGFKYIADGGFEGGFMREPYIEPYGLNGTYYGLNRLNLPNYYGALRAAAQNGWRVATHAVGDAAVDLVLEGYKQAHDAKPYGPGEWVVEHAFIAKPDHFPKIRDLGLILSVQDHLFLAAPSLRKMWGDQRAENTTPVRTYLDQGFLLTGGTDTAVVPENPWWAMYHFITRDTLTDGVYGANERVVNRVDVLRMFTLNYAKLLHEEQSKGSIAPGKLADFVVVSDDFLTVPQDKLEDLGALATYVGGKRVWLAPEVQNEDL